MQSDFHVSDATIRYFSCISEINHVKHFQYPLSRYFTAICCELVDIRHDISWFGSLDSLKNDSANLIFLIYCSRSYWAQSTHQQNSNEIILFFPNWQSSPSNSSLSMNKNQKLRRGSYPFKYPSCSLARYLHVSVNAQFLLHANYGHFLGEPWRWAQDSD